MSNATINIIENNARRNGVATINGIQVVLTDAPVLAGSDKQVAWAEDIRARMINDMVSDQVKAEFANGLADAHELEAWLEKATNAINAQVMPMLADKTCAKAWIDNRDNDIRAVLMG